MGWRSPGLDVPAGALGMLRVRGENRTSPALEAAWPVRVERAFNFTDLFSLFFPFHRRYFAKYIYIGDWGLNFGNGENYRNVILEEREKWEKDESKGWNLRIKRERNVSLASLPCGASFIFWDIIRCFSRKRNFAPILGNYWFIFSSTREPLEEELINDSGRGFS